MRTVLGVTLVLSTLLASPAEAQFTILGFDDLPGTETAIPNGYGGFVWDNFSSRNTCDISPDYAFCAGSLISPPNVAINGGGNPAAVRAVNGMPFNFLVGTFSSGTNYDMRLELAGFLNGSLVHALDIDLPFNSINAWSVDWIVDELRFTAFVDDLGAPAETPARFTLDEFYFAEYVNVVPEPQSVGMLIMGLAGLATVRRRRATIARPRNPLAKSMNAAGSGTTLASSKRVTSP